jgi:hypothetical protein
MLLPFKGYNILLRIIAVHHPKFWGKYKELEKAMPGDLSTTDGNYTLPAAAVGSLQSPQLIRFCSMTAGIFTIAPRGDTTLCSVVKNC